jgi:tetratricopeptide (TPR) repeat protein
MPFAQRVCGPVLPLLLLAGSLGVGLPASGQTAAQTQRLAQVTPSTITGRLDNTSASAEGRYVAVHPLEATAGEIITLELASDEFDAFLVLLNPSGEIFTGNDNSGDGTNAWLTVELPTSGVYQIVVSSRLTGETGSYTLSWRPATAADQSLQNAAQLNRQAIELYQAGRYGEAEPLFQEALGIRREQLGDRHPLVALSLNNLAALYNNQGRYDEAEPLYQQSLELSRELLGDSPAETLRERHPDVAGSLFNLGALRYNQGRYPETLDLFLEAEDIYLTTLGTDHPHTQALQSWLARTRAALEE